jgi:hypothetical protein
MTTPSPPPSAPEGEGKGGRVVIHLEFWSIYQRGKENAGVSSFVKFGIIRAIRYEHEKN